MKSAKILCSFILMVLAVIPFSTHCQAQTKAKQGIAGEVIWKEGNHMPTIGGSPSGITKKISREVVVYLLVNKSNAQQDDDMFFNVVKAKKVASVKSAKNGKFYIRLAPGKYSVFVKEKGKLYAKEFDGEGYINPVEVKKNEVTQVNLTLDYKAAY